MNLEQILSLRQSAGVDTIQGYLLISLAFILIMSGLYCYFIARIERKQSKAQLRKELSLRLVSHQRRIADGAWRPEGAGAKNERGAW